MLKKLFEQLGDVFDGDRAIEQHARKALTSAAPAVCYTGKSLELPKEFVDVMHSKDAHPICETIAQCAFEWVPPQTSSDAKYIEHSKCKVHVELIGPNGLVGSDEVRLGLYGMLPNSEYGIRTHPAEEIYIMLAGEALWKRDSMDYRLHHPGERSYHPSMMEHGTRTAQKAFMSVYVWHGDIATDNYQYLG